MTLEGLDGALAIRLAGAVSDVAGLVTLAEAAPHLLESTWSCAQEPEGPGSALVPLELGTALADDLARRGLDLVRLRAEGGDLALAPLAEGAAPTRWRSPRVRRAPRLIEALRPRRLPGEPLVDEALFVARPSSPAPGRLLGRLLLLGRGDAQVCAFRGPGDEDLFAVRLKEPPLYLLMSARDDEQSGLLAFARHGATSLWVAWSFEHPLASAAGAALARAGLTALVDERGVWLRAPADLRTRSIYDVLAPTLDAREVELRPAPADLRFQVELRLAPGPPADADLWLLTPERVLDLEPLIDACSSDELGRLTLARLCGEEGTRYLLRERVRPGVARMAARVSETLDDPGYVQVAGADNLYVPAGRRLTPLLRRDDLRRLLDLDRAHTVLLTEDRDGARIVTITEVEESPLQRWLDYVATDRRLELDRLLERSVFDFPEVAVAWPEARRVEPERPPVRERRAEARARKAIRRDARAEQEPAPEQAPETDAAARLRALRERARELEAQLVAGGCDEVAPWRELGAIKSTLGDPDEAIACLEAALFHGGAPHDPAVAGELLAASAAMFPAAPPEEQLADLLLSDRRSAVQAARLGALLLERIAAGAPPADELVQLALPLFSEARTPVSRRLAWSVLAAWHHHARDRLGLTRAKEAILGGVNERGLSDLHDLPRFVRAALAREEGGPDAEVDEGRTRQGQLAALEALWHEASAELTDIDVAANFTRVIFAVGFGRLGARAAAQELIAPVEAELDVHEPPNRALFSLYIARLAHETAGSTAEAWATDLQRVLEGLRDPKHRQVVQWLVKRSLWLGGAAPEEQLLGRPTRFTLPAGLEAAGLAEHLTREMAPAKGRFEYLIAEAVDVCLRRALASGSEAVLGEVLGAAEPGLEGLGILSHRAEAIGACIHAAACLGDDAALGRLVDALLDVARSPRLDSAREVTRAAQRCLIALRRFGGLEPARALLEALAAAHAYTTGDRVSILSTVAAGFMQLGEVQAADALLDRLCGEIFGGELDYVARAQAGLAAAGALRHWPNVARVERFRRFVAQIGVFRDTFTTGRYYETHRVMILEGVVDCLADSRTRQSDRLQGFLDQEEHALRRRIIADWSALCGR